MQNLETSPNDDNLNVDKRRILIVDDNQQIHADYRKVLLGTEIDEPANADYQAFFEEPNEESGDSFHTPLRELVEIDSALQGQEGLEKVKKAVEEGRQYSLAFVDLRMPPGWDGLRTVEEIWKVDPELQIVICTAYTDNSFADICNRLGRTDKLLILKKPFDGVEVYQLAVSLTEKWKLGRQAKLKHDDLERLVERRTEELRLASLRDPLTKVTNRAGFNAALEQGLLRSNENGTSCGVFLIDVDNLKPINDAYGHPCGDQLLVEVASLLKECSGELDTVARLGGDEFAIVQPDINTNAEHEALSQRIERHAKAFEFENRRITFSCSVGIAVAPTDSSTQDDLLKKADLALYRSKDEGQGKPHYYTTEMDNDFARTQEIYQGLLTALAEDQFILYYQPIADAQTGNIKSFEALVRWIHPEKGMIPPFEFIPVAEETALIVPIGDWVLEEACSQAQAWPQDVKVSVNLSSVQFREQYDLVTRVKRILDATGFDPTRLELEITETTVLDQSEYVFKCLNAFQDLGISIALDDFGVGFASLSYIQAFPFDKLKLDRSFVSSCQASAKTLAILKLVASLGIDLEMTTTAEGVETEEELKIVRDEGFKQVQGYLLGRPSKREDINQLFVDVPKAFANLPEYKPQTQSVFPKLELPTFGRTLGNNSTD